MANFQTKVVITATIILIVLLIIVALTIREGGDKVEWPPSISECPDYFQDHGKDGHVKCVNTLNIGRCGNKVEEIDFSQFKGQMGSCVKEEVADYCGLSWGGITYGYGSTKPCS
jgi:hypothetical protein